MAAVEPCVVSRRSTTSRTWSTRALDLAFVGLSAPVWLPVLMTVACAVVVSSGRPIFFRQERVGLAGSNFSMLKFRSMTTGDNPLVPDPSCITPIGRLLRRTSLDELPQLLNVMVGHMSLVGPRPMLPMQVRDMNRREQGRHIVRPGLTGLAQVSGRNELTWDERFDYDLTWATAPTVRSYLRILRRTIGVVCGGQGVQGHDPTDRFVQRAA